MINVKYLDNNFCGPVVGTWALDEKSWDLYLYLSRQNQLRKCFFSKLVLVWVCGNGRIIQFLWSYSTGKSPV